jgi:hypothetical protein
MAELSTDTTKSGTVEGDEGRNRGRDHRRPSDAHIGREGRLRQPSLSRARGPGGLFGAGFISSESYTSQSHTSARSWTPRPPAQASTPATGLVTQFNVDRWLKAYRSGLCRPARNHPRRAARGTITMSAITDASETPPVISLRVPRVVSPPIVWNSQKTLLVT